MAAFAAVSLSTCCCRRSRVRASLLPAKSVSLFCRRDMSGLWTPLYRVEPVNSNECHSVIYFDIATCRRLGQSVKTGKRTKEKEGAEREHNPKSIQNKQPTPSYLIYRGVRGGRAIQGHPLVASTASCFVYWNLSSSMLSV